MMNMMTTTGLGSGFIFFWILHVIAVLFFFIGVVFLVAWAIKTFDKKELKARGIWLIIIGSVLCLLTIGAIGRPWMGYGQGVGDAFMFRMMDFDDDDDDMMGGMKMSMHGMTMMLEGKSGDAFDEAFIEMMIPHHQGAIDMAELALENAGHQEIKNLATDIISAQQREIDMMNQWLRDWGYDE